MKQKKKNHKLLFQISLVLIPVFAALILGVSWIMYKSTVDGFLEAQNKNMELMLTRTSENINDLIFSDDDFRKWCIEQWENDPSLCDGSGPTVEEYDEYLEFMHSYKGYGATMDYVNAMSDRIQRIYLQTTYNQMKELFKVSAKDNKNDYLFLIYVDDDSFGSLLCDNLEKTKGMTKYDLDRKDHKAIDRILKNSSGKVEFERSEDFPEKGDYYVAYKPVIFDGKVKAVMGIVYNWDKLRKSMNGSLRRAFILGVGGVLLAMELVLFVLYRRTVRPLSKIRTAIVNYTDTKDTPMIVSDMFDINERNEFGYLADSIADLALEIEHYTKENVRIASERERAEKELYEAKVQIMVSQIRPHFMYNALSSIAMLCTLDPERAQEATVTFADYLRGNMDLLKQTAPVPFETELEHLKKYLYIEKLRFGKKLNIEYDIQTTDFKVPLLSIQPLVENAVKHGVGMKKKGGTVTISARQTDSGYEVVISDDGVGFDTDAPKKDDGRSHVGMENTVKRLKDMCGADVITTSAVGEGTTVRVILPKEEQDNEDSMC